MTRLTQAEHQRQRILDALTGGPLTMAELRWATGINNQRLAQYLLRMTTACEVTRARNGTRPDGQPCYVYRAAVSSTITASEIGAKLTANVNGGVRREVTRPAGRPIGRKQVMRIFGGLYL